MRYEPKTLSVPVVMTVPEIRPHDDVMRAGAEWRAWRQWSSPWYLRWRRLMWWKKPTIAPLNISELLYFHTFDGPPLMERALAKSLYVPAGETITETFKW